MTTAKAIGFAPPLLGPEPLRLALYEHREGLLVVEKPAGLVAWPHDWYRNRPTLWEAIEHERLRGKPELERLGVTGSGPVVAAEPDASGAAVLATTPEALERWRNAYGSGLVRLNHRLIARDRRPSAGSERLVQVPLGRSGEVPRLRFGGQFAKKAQTRFWRIESGRTWQLWEAESSFTRWHQIRAHAHSAGLEILGESVYANVAAPVLSKLRKNFRGDGDQPIFNGIALHLAHITGGPPSEVPLAVDIPEPHTWKRLRRWLVEA